MATIPIRGTWTLDVPSPEVWDVVVDLPTWPRWWPAIRAAAPVSEEAVELTFDTPSPLRPMLVTLEVVERDAPHRLRVAVTDGPLRGEGVVAIRDDPRGSVTSYDIGLKVRSLVFKPLEPILAQASRSGGRRRLAQAGADLAALAGGTLLASE